MTEKERMKKLLLEMKHESLGLTEDTVNEKTELNEGMAPSVWRDFEPAMLNLIRASGGSKRTIYNGLMAAVAYAVSNVEEISKMGPGYLEAAQDFESTLAWQINKFK